MTTEETMTTAVFKALAHEFRRKLLIFLADAPAGFTELQQELACQTGTLYHHLRILGDLVVQDTEKQWGLTDTGWLAYRVLTTTQEDFDISEFRKQALPTPIIRVINVIAPKRLFQIVENSPYHTIVEAIVLFLIFGYLLANSEVKMIGFFFDQEALDLIFAIVSVFVGWISLAVILSVVSKIMTSHPRDEMEIVLIFAIVPFSMIPLVLLPIIQIIGFNEPEFTTILATVLQLWVLILLTQALSVIFEIKIEKALLVGIVTMYILIATSSLVIGFV